MFKNFKAIAHMRTPMAAIDPIILDSIITAAKVKEILSDEYYSGKNVYSNKEIIDKTLGPILDKQYGVYCTSAAVGNYREYVGSWVKRWDDGDDDIVKFKKGGKERVDIGSGAFKNYHMPIVLKSYKDITFYVRGDMEEVERLLENYIFYLGKKCNQGYGQIREWEFKETKENWSIWQHNKPMRPIPIKHCQAYIESQMQSGETVNARRHPVIPPYWRNDNIELCIMPEGY